MWDFETKPCQMGVCGLICVSLGVLDIRKFGNLCHSSQKYKSWGFKSFIILVIVIIRVMYSLTFTDHFYRLNLVLLMTTSGEKVCVCVWNHVYMKVTSAVPNCWCVGVSDAVSHTLSVCNPLFFFSWTAVCVASPDGRGINRESQWHVSWQEE